MRKADHPSTMARCPHCDANITMLGIDDEASRASLATVHICPACEAVLGVTGTEGEPSSDAAVEP
jgi:uncharacterized paraquat-inducible protein A